MPALQLRFSFLRGWASTWPMHQHTQTAAGDLPDSVRLQSAARRFPTRLPQNSSFGLSLRSLRFRCLKPPETGGKNLARLARVPRIDSMQTVGFRARAELEIALFVGMA